MPYINDTLNDESEFNVEDRKKNYGKNYYKLYVNNQDPDPDSDTEPAFELELSSHQQQLFNFLGPFFLPEDDSLELTKVINSYVKLGLKLDLTKLIEMSHKIPKVTSALKLSSDFWNIISLVMLGSKNANLNNTNTELTESLINQSSIALSIVAYISKVLQEPLLMPLISLSLIHNVQWLVDEIDNIHDNDENSNDQLVNNKLINLINLLNIITFFTEEHVFIELYNAFLLNLTNKYNIKTIEFKMLISQYAERIALEAQHYLINQKSAHNLLFSILFTMLSMRLQDLNVKFYEDIEKYADTEKPEDLVKGAIDRWQDITEGFIELQNIAECAKKVKFGGKHGNGSGQPTLIKPHDQINQELTEETTDQDLSAEENDIEANRLTLETNADLEIKEPVPVDKELRIARKNLVDLLNEHNNWQAASNLQDLCTEIDSLDLSIENIYELRHKQFILPKLNIPDDMTVPKEIKPVEALDIIEFRIINTDSRVKIFITCNNPNVDYFPWYTEIHYKALPRRIKIPRFQSELWINKEGDLIIKKLPKHYNYNFRLSGNLYIEKLIIAGRLKALIRDKIVNLNVCAAKGGIVLFTKAIENQNGVISTFNVGLDETKELSAKLGLYRLLTGILGDYSSSLKISAQKSHILQSKIKEISTWLKENAQDLATGKIYIHATNSLNNYKGSILSGDFCWLHSQGLDNRHGIIASHNSEVKNIILSDQIYDQNTDLNGLICINSSAMWAKTTLQVKAPRIIKDDTSSMIGLASVDLRSFEGNVSWEGPMVGRIINLIQDHGCYYQYNNVRAETFKITTSVTSNILERKLYVDNLEVSVTDINSYEARVTRKLLINQQIKLSLPSIKVLNKIYARGSIEIYTPIYQLAEESLAPLYTVDLNAKLSANRVVIVGHGVKQSINSKKNVNAQNRSASLVDSSSSSSSAVSSSSSASSLHSNFNIINAVNLSIVTCNLQLNSGFKVKENALLHAIGNNISYIPENLQAVQWLGLHFPKVKDFIFPKIINGSLYVKVLADDIPIVLSKNLSVRNKAVVVAPGSWFGATEDELIEKDKEHKDDAFSINEVIRLHAGKEGNEQISNDKQGSILIQAKGFSLTREGLFAGAGITY